MFTLRNKWCQNYFMSLHTPTHTVTQESNQNTHWKVESKSVNFLIVDCFSRYLALVSALASGADWLFIPEAPPKEGWEDRMCSRLETVRQKQLIKPPSGMTTFLLKQTNNLVCKYVRNEAVSLEMKPCNRESRLSRPNACFPPEPYNRVKAEHYHHRRRSHRHERQAHHLYLRQRCEF